MSNSQREKRLTPQFWRMTNQDFIWMRLLNFLGMYYVLLTCLILIFLFFFFSFLHLWSWTHFFKKGVMQRVWKMHWLNVQWLHQKRLLQKLLILIQPLVAGMHWQKLFIHACLIGMQRNILSLNLMDVINYFFLVFAKFTLLYRTCFTCCVSICNLKLTT